jgi:hypothetical protein
MLEAQWNLTQRHGGTERSEETRWVLFAPAPKFCERYSEHNLDLRRDLIEMSGRLNVVGGVCAGAILSLLAIGGCGDRGPRLVPAGGTVKYKGAPLAAADVVFMPDSGSVPSIGRTDEQGKFTLKTSARPGAPVGGHKVAITAIRQKRKVSDAEAVGMTSEQIAANHESLIPAKYNNTISSELTATVGDDAKANEFVFDLK